MDLKEKFINCWFCDNLISQPDKCALIYLGFPRCFILFDENLPYNSSFDDFMSNAHVQWIETDKGTESERKHVINLLYEFCKAQDAAELSFIEKQHEQD